MVWADFKPKALTRPQFVERIRELEWTSWLPIGIVIHNTAAPTLAQWAESGPKHAARIKNLQSYYEGMGWHGGPHWFISRNWINEFSNPLRRGTHSPSFNAQYFGIEMVGDYAREAFNSGDGALVRDNTVYAAAALCWRFGFNPNTDIKFHKEDPRTNHDCPGKLVSKPDFIRRVIDEMHVQAGRLFTDEKPELPEVKDTPRTTRFMGIVSSTFGGSKEIQPSAYGGMVDPKKLGVSLPYKFRGPRPRVRVFYDGKHVDCDVVDVGPWNTNDPYWEKSNRPQAETGTDTRGRKTNHAGIDLTPATAVALGALRPGFEDWMGMVDWEFIEEEK